MVPVVTRLILIMSVPILYSLCHIWRSKEQKKMKGYKSYSYTLKTVGQKRILDRQHTQLVKTKWHRKKKENEKKKRFLTKGDVWPIAKLLMYSLCRHDLIKELYESPLMSARINWPKFGPVLWDACPNFSTECPLAVALR